MINKTQNSTIKSSTQSSNEKTLSSQSGHLSGHQIDNQKELTQKNNLLNVFSEKLKGLFSSNPKKIEPILPQTPANKISSIKAKILNLKELNQLSTAKKTGLGLTSLAFVCVATKYIIDSLKVNPNPLHVITPSKDTSSIALSGIIALTALTALATYKYKTSQSSNLLKKDVSNIITPQNLSTRIRTKDQNANDSANSNLKEENQVVELIEISETLLPLKENTDFTIETSANSIPTQNSNAVKNTSEMLQPFKKYSPLQQKFTFESNSSPSSNLNFEFSQVKLNKTGLRPVEEKSNPNSFTQPFKNNFASEISQVKLAKQTIENEKSLSEIDPYFLPPSYIPSSPPEVFPSSTSDLPPDTLPISHQLIQLKFICGEIYEKETSFLQQIEDMLKIKNHFTEDKIDILANQLKPEERESFKKLFSDLLNSGNIEINQVFSNELLTKLESFETQKNDPFQANMDELIQQYATEFAKIHITDELIIGVMKHTQIIVDIFKFLPQLEKAWEAEMKQISNKNVSFNIKYPTVVDPFIPIHQHFTKYKLHICNIHENAVLAKKNGLKLTDEYIFDLKNYAEKLSERIDKLNEKIKESDYSIINIAKEVTHAINKAKETGCQLIKNECSIECKAQSYAEYAKAFTKKTKYDLNVIEWAKQLLNHGIDKANLSRDKVSVKSFKQGLVVLSELPVKNQSIKIEEKKDKTKEKEIAKAKERKNKSQSTGDLQEERKDNSIDHLEIAKKTKSYSSDGIKKEKKQGTLSRIGHKITGK